MNTSRSALQDALEHPERERGAGEGWWSKEYRSTKFVGDDDMRCTFIYLFNQLLRTNMGEFYSSLLFCGHSTKEISSMGCSAIN